MKTPFTARTSGLSAVVIAALVASMVAGALSVTPAYAVDPITVNTATDELTAANGLCSLREALANANADNNTYTECGSGAGTTYINFAADYTITLTLGSALTITGPISIFGNTSGGTIIEAGTCNPVAGPCATTWQVFVVSHSSGSVRLQDMTIRNGRGGNGGGVSNSGSGTLNLDKATLTQNYGVYGGGLHNGSTGTVSVERTTITGNAANTSGGGLYNYGTMIISGSTIYNNTGPGGAGIGNGSVAAVMTLANSTVVGNTTTGVGGGLYNDATLTVANSTFSGNTAATDGGALYNAAGGSLSLYNTILANSFTAANDCYNVAGDGLANSGMNLIQTNGPSGHMCGSPTVTTSPFSQFSLPTGNGGPTGTIAVGPGSSAYNLADTTVCTNSPVTGKDQRGVQRRNGSCDLGSYEYHAAPTNDAFAGATTISALPATEMVDTGGATTSTSPGDPTFTCIGGQRYQSVWYSFIPAADVDVVVTTIGSDYDTVLAVWTGVTPPALTSVACDDDIGAPFSYAYSTKSRVHFRALSPTTYWIEVASFGYGGGDLQLNLTATDDFDGDARTDPAVFHKAAGNWFYVGSDTAGVFVPALGFGDDTNYSPVPGDYDGFGKTDAAVYEKATGNWFAVSSIGGFFAPALNFGNAGYLPVPGDYDGDGQTDPALFEKATGNWFVVGSTAGFFSPALNFGNDANYIAVPGDYDGDGTTDAAVFSRVGGNWFVVGSTAGFFSPALNFGNDAGYIPVPGDYDGDGTTDAAVFARASGNWFVVGSTAGFFAPALNFGNDTSYIPQPGDYDADGSTDPAVYEKAAGNWFVVGSSAGFMTPALGFGDSNFLPVVPKSQ